MITTPTVAEYRLSRLRQALGRRYAFEAFIGRGAFASVYRVRNLALGRVEALKVLSDTHDGNRRFARRFAEEARMAASLDHPNIVKVFDFGEIDGILWYSMQYIDGPTLRLEMQHRMRLEPSQVTALALPIISALDYSHRRGIIHRDIKPSNILLGAEGRVYLMDFGIAKSTESALRTMTGSVLGTPTYMAPEQVERQELDGRVDLYALGTAMYEMLAGRPPFEEEDMVRAMFLRLNQEALPIRQLCPNVEKPLASIIMRCLERHPEDRFPDARTLYGALLEIVEDTSQAGRLIPRTRPPIRANLPGLAAAAGSEPASPEKAAERPTVAGEGRPRRRSAWVWAALLLLFTSVAVGWRWQGREGVVASENGTAHASGPVIDTGPEASLAMEERGNRGTKTETPRTGPPSVPSLDSRDEPAAALLSGAPGERSSPAAAPPPPAPTAGRESPGTRTTDRAVPELPAAVPRRAATPPVIVERVDPELASEHLPLCAGRRVTLTVRVGEEGEALTVRDHDSEQPECGAAAVAAARRFTYAPGRDAEGQPTPAKLTFRLKFGELSHEPSP